MFDPALSDGGELAEWLRRVFERTRSENQTDILGLIGSSRRDGDTARLTRAVFENLPGAGLIDLSAYDIAPYDYHYRQSHDDFIEIAQKMAQAKTIVFASPVYWYAMSAQMKLFFDRLTDLTETHKPIGKSLAGKTAFLIATGGSPSAPASFEPPFRETARYFNMNWGGMLYGQKGEARDKGMVKTFASNIAELSVAPYAIQEIA
ncbi:MAG: hypothetical protein DHS20C05_21880 [Hyphococcus sp.]|nr:MAG: hypothetical protein DHS20C05_21880 [Marinicaulis sp.]